jgi:Ca2+-binding EF-hand superfamily protein
MVADFVISSRSSYLRAPENEDDCGLDAAEMRILRDIFALADTDRSGFISGPEVGNFMQMVGLQTGQSDVRAAAKELDAVSHLKHNPICGIIFVTATKFHTAFNSLLAVLTMLHILPGR